MSLRFQKNTEDFSCEYCSTFVRGSGFTNHCPVCLFSKHVDIHPGDREERCGGLMEPRSVLLKKGTYVIVHRCLRCGIEKRNKAVEADNLAMLFGA